LDLIEDGDDDDKMLDQSNEIEINRRDLKLNEKEM